MRKKIYITAFILIIIDFFVKRYLIYTNLDISIIPNFFRISLTYNTGGAFSLFSNHAYFLAALGIIVIVYLDRCFVKEKTTSLTSISLSLLIGGIIGNIIDRIMYGHVIDFLSFKFGSYNFPVFNLADIFICTGFVLLIISLLRGGKNANNS